jgi:hypothetical protein
VINFSWNIFLYASTSEFDLEIGHCVEFAKINLVVAKNRGVSRGGAMGAMAPPQFLKSFIPRFRYTIK